MSGSSPEKGFALAAVIFALVVLSVLSTGGFYLARQQSRIGVATTRTNTAFYLAERGAMEVMSEWQTDRFARLAQWTTTTVADTVAEGIWSVNVTRLARRLYFLLASGTATEGQDVYGGANRMLGIVARIDGADIDPRAALTTVGDLTVGGSSVVNGNDVPPKEWSGYCDPPLPPRPGILIDSLSNVSTEGKKHEVLGDPPNAEDNNMTSDTLLAFGDLKWDEMVALADLVFPSGTYIRQTYPDSVLVDGKYVCQTSNSLNWGDPYNPGGACGRYFPIIYATGDLFIEAHDYGQGILLVEGDLTFKGGFEFFGPVIVKGNVITEGTGGHFIGGLIAANVNLSTSDVLGNALVQYSACAVERALWNSSLSRVRPLERRSFADLSLIVAG
jgi:hypothetical protein